MKRLLISGSRYPTGMSASQRSAWNAMVDRCCEYVSGAVKGRLVMVGEATGVDGITHTVATKAGVVCVVFSISKPYSRSLARARDDMMLEVCDEVAVFRFAKSRGSTYVLDKAREAGKLVHLDDVA